MKRIVVASACILTSVLNAQEAGDSDAMQATVRFPSEFRIVDPRSHASTTFESSSSDNRVVPLSVNEVELPGSASMWQPRGLNAVLVGAVRIRQSILVGASDAAGHDARLLLEDLASFPPETAPDRDTLPGIALPSNTSSSAGRDELRPNGNIEVFSLEIEGGTVVFSIVQSVADPSSSDIRHVTAAVQNGDGYVRFAIDRAEAKMVGTVQSRLGHYRIISHPSEPVELIYRMPPRRAGDVDRYVAVSSYLPMPTELGHLEQRHLTAEAIADIQPNIYIADIQAASSSVEIGLNQVRQGGISQIDSSRLDEPQILGRLMRELAPLLGVTGQEDYEIVRVVPGPGAGERSIEFRQLVNGIPFRRSNSGLQVDADGNVKRLRLREIVNTGKFEVEAPRITLQEAKLQAVAELVRRMPDASIEGPGEACYEYDRSTEKRLIPEAHFLYSGGGTAKVGRIVVRTHTGEVFVFDRRRPSIWGAVKQN